MLGLPDFVSLDPEKLGKSLGRGYVSEVEGFASRIANCDLSTATCKEGFPQSSTCRPSGRTWLRYMKGTHKGLMDRRLHSASFEQFGKSVEGDYHNTGHMRIALACSSQKRRGTHSVMSAAAASGRDPIFYSWHQHIEDLFQLYKDTRLGSYTRKDFELSGGLKVLEVKTILDKEALKTRNDVENILVTFDENAVVGDKKRHHVYRRLNHYNYKYQIRMANPKRISKKVIVRIWLGLGKCLK